MAAGLTLKNAKFNGFAGQVRHPFDAPRVAAAT
jgi:hypothetical protein